LTKNNKRAGNSPLGARVLDALADLRMGGGRRAAIAVALYFVVCGLYLYGSFGGSAYRAGDIVESDIVSPRTMEYEDAEATEAARRAASEKIEPVYSLAPGFRSGIEDVFQRLLETLRSRGPAENFSRLEKELYDFGLGGDSVRALLSMDVEKAVQLWVAVSTALNRLGEMENVGSGDIMGIAEEAGRLARQDDLDHSISSVAHDIVSVAVKSNLETDAEATENLRKEAAQSAPPVVRTIRKNEVIVRRGDPISAKHLDIMKTSGVGSGGDSWNRLAGKALLIALSFLIIGAFVKTFHPRIYRDEKKLLIFATLLALAAAWSALIIRVPSFSGYLIGVAAGTSTILMCVMLSRLMTLAAMPVFLAMTALSLEMAAEHLLVAIAASLAAYFYSVRTHDKDNLMKAGAAVSVVSMVSILIITLIKFSSAADAAINIFIFGGLNGMLSFVFAAGLMPAYEKVFNVTTPHRLLELSNPEEPLLKRLLIEAPGTYHHSILVGNLAETAAEAVGADALLVRIACYYHDIGKLKRPYFFIENRMDGLSQLTDVAPTLGALVISSHVKDGVEMARENRLPEEVIELISEHHGTCLISFFYQQARARVEAGECEDVGENRFRYPGPRPSRIEGAIIMLADSCEAAVRSLKAPTPKAIESIVDNIVVSRLREGQFEQCDVTLKQIDSIRNSLLKTLAGVYHSRMEYPDLEEFKEREAAPRKNGAG